MLVLRSDQRVAHEGRIKQLVDELNDLKNQVAEAQVAASPSPSLIPCI